MKEQDPFEDEAPDQALREKFQRLAFMEEEAPPQSLKEHVFSSLDTIQLAADITGLFTVRFAWAELEILDAISFAEAWDEEE